MRWCFFVVFALLLAPVDTVGAQSASPVNVEIKGGKVVGESTVRVRRGDTVTLRISSDAKVALHLHGYDIERTAEPDVPAVFEFNALAAGRFSISTIQAAPKGAKIHGHGAALLYLEVLPR